MMSARPPEWPEERVALLASLWAEGVSCAEIGRLLNKTPNAVIGKVHRLDLPGRPSPIKPGPDGVRETRRRERRERPVVAVVAVIVQPIAVRLDTLPPLVSLSLTNGRSLGREGKPDHGDDPLVGPEGGAGPLHLSLPPLASVEAARKAQEPAKEPEPPKPAPATPSRSKATCQWPLNDRRPWKFCGSACALGEVYCRKHAKVAYVRVRDRREDAA